MDYSKMDPNKLADLAYEELLAELRKDVELVKKHLDRGVKAMEQLQDVSRPDAVVKAMSNLRAAGIL
jgi:hypothetical protein